MAENIKVDLDPKKLLQSIRDLSEGFKKLSDDVEEALGKQAVKSIDKLENESEKGSNKILTYFQNMGKRLKEDLKTAFDIGSIAGGLNMAKEIGSGIKQVFDLEKAFDKLNTRLGLTGQQFAMFKKQVGSAVANTGQKLEDVFPGIETAAAKGGVKSPEELSSIGEALGKVRAATGETTDTLADSVVEILKTQGKKINAQSFNQTLDALQAARVQGSFKTAAEAGAAIEQISPYAKQMGLGTREMGALAATASKSGTAGTDILRQLMEQASKPGGMDQLNSVFGVKLFKNGKLDASQLGNINTQRFGKFSQQVMEQATGIQGASGADLSRFVDSFKDGMAGFNKVVSGANETSSQFDTATDNLASSLDKFKESAKNSGREVGESLSEAAHDIIKGQFGNAGTALKGAGQSIWENKGTIGASLGIAAGAAALAGSGANSILSKIPGAGKLLGGMAGGAVAEAMGVQKVYVVNASEIGGGSVVGDAASKLLKFGSVGALGTAGAYGAAGIAGVGLGYGIATGADKLTGGGYSNVVGKPGEWLAKLFEKGNDDIFAQANKQFGGNRSGMGDNLSEQIAKGTEQGHMRANKNRPVQMTNPSSVRHRGGAF